MKPNHLDVKLNFSEIERGILAGTLRDTSQDKDQPVARPIEIYHVGGLFTELLSLDEAWDLQNQLDKVLTLIGQNSGPKL